MEGHEKIFKEPNCLSQFSPIWGNQLFIPGRTDVVFHLWRAKGLRMIQDVYLSKSDTLVCFQELQDRFYMEKKYFFNSQASYRETGTMY